MATAQESAVFSLHVYTAQADNKPVLPINWTRLTGGEGTAGFAYAVFQGPGGQIVISYRGTDDASADWIGNAGLTISQERQAALVAKQYIDQFGASNVSFTGHSLGGGLAATMAVWFNRPATVFDPAPTQSSAIDYGIVNSVIGNLGGANAPQSIRDFLINIIGEFALREANVTAYYAPGSIVYAETNSTAETITGLGLTTPLNFGIANMGSVLSQVDMHSQALLTAGILSPAFKDSTVGVQRALPVMFDTTFYNLSTKSSEPNLFIDLIKSQQQSATDGKLTHLAASFNKLGANVSGLNAAAQDAIIAQTLEWYYWNTAFASATTKQFFKLDAANGLLQYTTARGSDFADAKDKAKPHVAIWLNTLLNPGAVQNGNPIPISHDSYHQWNVVAGAPGATAVAVDNNKSQAFVGNAGADLFVGGNKSDLLIGAGGADTLQGRGGSDLLLGGAGLDTYLYESALGDTGLDTVYDSDGIGRVVLNGQQLTGGAQYGDNKVYKDAQGHVYTLVGGGRLIVDGNILIENWSAGQLGLNMTGAIAEVNPITAEPTIFGDLQQNKDDVLSDTAANDLVVSGIGNDQILGSGGGSDIMDGGIGQDAVYGGLGDDLIVGGSDADILSGEAGNDRVYADAAVSVSQAIVNGNSLANIASQGDWLAGSGGNDTLVGGSAKDALSGGGGADLMIGGAGDDDIFGDIDWVAGSFAWTGTNNYFTPVSGIPHPTDFGGDLIYAGRGNDDVWGGRGNDVIFGEDGDDIISGNGENDVLLGGDGNDILLGDSIDYVGDVEANMGDDYLDGGAGMDTLYGGAGGDILIGGTSNDVLQGGAGQDVYIFNRGDGIDVVIDSKADNNIFRMGAGFSASDVKWRLGSLLLDLGGGDAIHFGDFDPNNVYAGAAVSSIEFDDGTSFSVAELLALGFDLEGTELADLMTGTNINDRISGLDGNDTLVGNGGDDIIAGGAGDDSILGDNSIDYVPAAEHGNDVVDGGDGNDTLHGLVGNDSLSGGLGVDYLYGGDGDDSLEGGDGIDFLSGGAGNDTILGGDGNDNIYWYGGQDVVRGGAGNDSISAQGDGQAIVQFGRGEGQDNLYRAFGSVAVTTVRFDVGLSAGDLVAYREDIAAGHSVLVVGIAGTDEFINLGRYAFADQTPTGLEVVTDIRLADGSQWTPGSGAIGVFEKSAVASGFMDGTGSADILFAPTGSGQLTGGGGDDVLFSTQTTTPGTLSITASFNFALEGGDGADRLYGGIANDILEGNSGNDFLSGGSAADLLRGGDGDDWLDGGTHGDQLYGGSGSNTYVFARGYNADVIFAARPSGGMDWQTLILTDINPGDVTLDARLNAIWESFEGLEIRVNGTSDSLTIREFFLPDSFSSTDMTIDEIWFQDGTIWHLPEIIAHLVVPGVALEVPDDGDGWLLSGGAGNDTLNGKAGINALAGGIGDDTMVGGGGNDTFYVRDAGDVIVELPDEGTDEVKSLISWTLGANIENLTLSTPISYAGAGTLTPMNINGTGNDLNNLVTGNGGNNVLDGAGGGDILVGGLGDDTYYVDNTGDVCTELADEGIDVMYTSITRTLDANLENLILMGSGNIGGNGNSRNNHILGNAGNNALNGSTGIDTMVGGLGDDTYTVDNLLDVVTELAGEGTDTLVSSINMTLIDELENLTLSGTTSISGAGNGVDNLLIGNTGANLLQGKAGNDTLDGKAGADRMEGGGGNDRFVVDTAGDVVVELLGEGTDTVSASITYTLTPYVENLTLTGTTAINGTGNDLDNVMNGNSATNVMTGGLGNDTYVLGTGDSVVELAGGGVDTVQSAITRSIATWAEVENLTLTGTTAINATGNAQANYIMGNSGINTINGGLGADTMLGAQGSDIYVVDNIDDFIIENFNEGADAVQASVNYTLAPNVENLTLTGTAVLNGTGNVLANRLTGNSASNILDGGAGIDTMTGGAGNDTYIVDDAADVTTEAFAAGTDLVISTVSKTLAAEVENLTLTGSSNINATGNSLANVLTGNGGDNILSGGTGSDTMIGGLGNDTYVVDATGDVVTEAFNAGTDLMQSSVSRTLDANVENLTLTGTAITGTGNALNNAMLGNASNNSLWGLAGNDTLDGGSGNDTLVGGDGLDWMTGGLGVDVFDFNLLSESAVGATRDVILDFSAAQLDKLDLAGIDANVSLANDQAFSFIGSAPFSAVGQLRFAGDVVYGNVNGDTIADFEIQLVGVSSLVATNFVL